MATLISTLDALCAELSRAFEQANADLALPDSEAKNPSEGGFSYSLPSQTKYDLHIIPYAEFHPDKRYRLSELSFSTSCYFTTRRRGLKLQNLLLMGRPNWLQKIRRVHIPCLLEIHVVDGILSYRFDLTKTAAPNRHDDVWWFALSAAQLTDFKNSLSTTSFKRSVWQRWDSGLTTTVSPSLPKRRDDQEMSRNN